MSIESEGPFGISNDSAQSEIDNNLGEEGIVKIENREIATPGRGETVIYEMCNIEDIRDPNSEDGEIGALYPEKAKEARAEAKGNLDTIIQNVIADSGDPKELRILVIGSGTDLKTPHGLESEHKRALETAKFVLEGFKESAKEAGLSNEVFMTKNNRSGIPSELTKGKMDDVHFIRESPGYDEFLKEKSNTDGSQDNQYWEDYEADTYRETREEMGAEGPGDIAKRVKDHISTVAEAMEFYHKNYPDTRVIVVDVSHRDNLAPYIEESMGRKERGNVLVKKGAGISLALDSDHKSSKTTIGGQDYKFNFWKRSERKSARKIQQERRIRAAKLTEKWKQQKKPPSENI